MPVFAADPLPFSSVVAHWSFDDLNDTRVPDSGPNGYHGVMTGQNEVMPEPAPGIRGNGLRFPPEHRAWVDLDKRLQIAPPFTFAAWVKLETTRGAVELLGQKGHSAREGIRIAFSTRQFRFEYSDGAENIVVAYDPHQTRVGQWAFVAVTHDGNEIALYVDGQEVKRVAARPGVVGRRAMLLGNYAVHKDTYRFVGTMDEVVVLQEALDARGIARLGQWALGKSAATPNKTVQRAR